MVIPSAGAGGALRNENGDWEDGFTARLGSNKIEEAESWVRALGMQLYVRTGPLRTPHDLTKKTYFTYLCF